MPDINTIRRDIDGLHAKATGGRWGHHDDVNPHLITSSDLDSDGFYQYIGMDGDQPDDFGCQFIIAAHAAWPTISAALAEAETLRRKARAFDAIAQAWVENRFSLTIGADNKDGYVDIDSLEPDDTAETLLTAIEALEAKETT
jgi:hypothetical protein